MTAWQNDVRNALVTTLLADAVLSTYCEAITKCSVLRDEDLPDVVRHGILVGPPSWRMAEVHSPVTSFDEITIELRACVLVWDPTNEEAAVSGETVVGLGTSTVGVAKFAEDIGNCLRLNTLNTALVALGRNSLEETGREIDGVGFDLRRVVSPARDRIWREAVLTWTGLIRNTMERTA